MSRQLLFKEKCKFDFVGEVFIKVGEPNKKLTKEEIINCPDHHLKNIIVDTASILIAQWANQTASASSHIPGITHLAIGIGSDSWDKFNPPLATASTTILENEVGRQLRTASGTPFVDSGGNSTATPTPIVDFEFTFEGGASGIDAILTEMGLFGGENAEVTNSGTMFNYLTFSAISKPQNAELTIVWRINFLPEGI